MPARTLSSGPCPANATSGRWRTHDYAAFARRIIRAHARRVADGDIEALPGLLRLLVRSRDRHR